MDTEGSFAGRKVIGGAADHSSTASVEIKNVWSCTFTSPYTYTAKWIEVFNLTTMWICNINTYNVGSR